MKYLCFDIECCDGHHICEFGYVLIDEKFNILERDCITINPEHKFKLTGRAHESDITLAFPEIVYFNSPTFDFYYDRIKKLLTLEDCQIVGFSLQNDTGFLATAYELYNKEPVSFEYIDFQKLYQGYTNAKSRTSVENIVNELQISDIQLHKSDDDSLAVIRALQEISKKEQLTLPDTIAMLKKKNKDYRAEKAKEHNLSLIEKLDSGNEKAQRDFLKNFITKLKHPEEKKDDLFFGKVVCISSTLQHEHFNEFLALVKQIYFYGATYSGKSSECDIFIRYDDNREEKRYIGAVRAIEDEGKKIQILSFEETLTFLHINREYLTKVDFIHKKNVPQRKSRSYIDKENSKTTLGDILAAKGINLAFEDKV